MNMANMGSGFQIRVTTESLVNTAGSADKYISMLQKYWNEVLATMENTIPYWMGDGAETKRKEILTFDKDVQEMLLRLQEYVDDLQKMAGIYVKAEAVVEELSFGLPDDVIL